jgi:hypothetical protein
MSIEPKLLHRLPTTQCPDRRKLTTLFPMCTCARFDSLCDASKVEERLTPYEEILEQVQAVLFWQNPIVMAILLISVNALFWVVGLQDLSFLPTFFLLLTVKSLLEFLFSEGNPVRAPVAQLFPPVSQTGPYPILKAADIAPLIASGARAGKNAIETLFPKAGPSLASSALSLAVLLGLFGFFLLVETFWVSVVVVNAVLLLPAVVFHPKVKEVVRPQIERLWARITVK